LGLSRTAIVETTWWPVPGDYYSNTFTALGGTITSRHKIASTSEFTATLQAIRAENPEVIVNFYTEPNWAVAGGQFSKIAHDLGMTGVPIGWNSDTNDESALATYASVAGLAAEGDYAAMKGVRLQDMPGWADCLAAYQAAHFPHEPDDPGPFGPYAYDAARIIIAAIERAQSADPAAIRNQIAATRDFQGVVGTYRGFDTHGDVIPQWSWLERYRNGQWLMTETRRVYLPLVLRNR